jgi:hypothetical protein
VTGKANATPTRPRRRDTCVPAPRAARPRLNPPPGLVHGGPAAGYES